MSGYSWILLFGSVLWFDVPWLSNKFSCEEKRFSQTRWIRIEDLDKFDPTKNRLRWESLKKTSINAVQEATNVRLFQPTPRSKLKVSHLCKVMWFNQWAMSQMKSLTSWWSHSWSCETETVHVEWVHITSIHSVPWFKKSSLHNASIFFFNRKTIKHWPTFTPNLLINQRFKRLDDPTCWFLGFKIWIFNSSASLSQLLLSQLRKSKIASWGKVHQKVSQGYNRPAASSTKLDHRFCLLVCVCWSSMLPEILLGYMLAPTSKSQFTAPVCIEGCLEGEANWHRCSA